MAWSGDTAGSAPARGRISTGAKAGLAALAAVLVGGGIYAFAAQGDGDGRLRTIHDNAEVAALIRAHRGACDDSRPESKLPAGVASAIRCRTAKAADEDSGSRYVTYGLYTDLAAFARAAKDSMGGRNPGTMPLQIGDGFFIRVRSYDLTPTPGTLWMNCDADLSINLPPGAYRRPVAGSGCVLTDSPPRDSED
ncbi:hypothetical protein [Kitasatospora sp. NPDC050543]|uniref:hypothetical protein n=1 Tax=Kitasatospora sp. NPDC050543 TaxID=3364054 RepID=UPI00379BC468